MSATTTDLFPCSFWPLVGDRVRCGPERQWTGVYSKHNAPADKLVRVDRTDDGHDPVYVRPEDVEVLTARLVTVHDPWVDPLLPGTAAPLFDGPIERAAAELLQDVTGVPYPYVAVSEDAHGFTHEGLLYLHLDTKTASWECDRTCPCQPQHRDEE